RRPPVRRLGRARRGVGGEADRRDLRRRRRGGVSRARRAGERACARGSGAHEEQAIVLALGGGAVPSARVRDALGEALTIWLDVDVETCWERVRGSDRPLARDEAEFRRLYEERRKLYAEVADVVAHDVHDVVLAAAGVVVERG